MFDSKKVYFNYEVDLKGIKEERLTPYFDLPIQHSSSRLLQSMNRRGDREFLLSLIKKIRDKVPNAISRTNTSIRLPSTGRNRAMARLWFQDWASTFSIRKKESGTSMT